MALPEGLLDSVKNDLSITWIDVQTDANIDEIITEGITLLDKTLGEIQTYEKGSTSRTLLKEFCIYARAHKIDEFLVNYNGMILAEIQRIEIKNAIAESVAT